MFDEFKKHVASQIQELREENLELKTIVSYKKVGSSEKNNGKAIKDAQAKK